MGANGRSGEEPGGRQLFGTDGIRGRANVYPMTGEVMLELGRAVALCFRLGPQAPGANGGRRHRVLIAKDTRLSGYMLEDALAAGLCSMGLNVLQVGPIPTPGLAFLTVDMRCDAGAMISASHNPFQDNGVKFFSKDGFKLPDEIETRIEELMHSDELRSLRPDGADIGRARRIEDAAGRYIVFLKKTFPADLDLSGMRIAVDCANGAAYRVAPTVLEELGADVVAIGDRPNGTNINERCGAMHPEALARAVVESGADLGLALDGDADRALFVDESGEIVDGDRVLAMCAIDLHGREALRQGKICATVLSNLGLDVALERHGIGLVRTAVGDRYVVEEMRRSGLNLGGEQSGHLIFLDHNTTGDGILSGLQVLGLLRRSGKPLSELASVMDPFPQVQRGVRVARKPPLDELPELARDVERVESDLAGRGRVLVRYSGTEPLARVMVEGEDLQHIEGIADELSQRIRTLIGEEGA